jgi:hypothetical protein
MNWIEIDKILYRLYNLWDGKDIEDYYTSVRHQFKWTRSQAETATQWIIKQKENKK